MTTMQQKQKNFLAFLKHCATTFLLSIIIIVNDFDILVFLLVINENVTIESCCRFQQTWHSITIVIDAKHFAILILDSIVISIVFASQIKVNSSIFEHFFVERAILKRKNAQISILGLLFISKITHCNSFLPSSLWVSQNSVSIRRAFDKKLWEKWKKQWRWLRSSSEMKTHNGFSTTMSP